MIDHPVEAASDAKAAQWLDINELPTLAFDHQHIMEVAVERLRGKVRYQPIGFELLPNQFTLTQLQQLYETILDKPLNKRNFRTKILKLDILTQLDKQTNVPHRPAFLYKFDKHKYEQSQKEGLIFEI